MHFLETVFTQISYFLELTTFQAAADGIHY